MPPILPTLSQGWNQLSQLWRIPSDSFSGECALVGLITRWTPVKGLTFSAEVMWLHLDQKFTGAAALAAAAPKPTTLYEFKDQSTVFLNVRVQRNF